MEWVWDKEPMQIWVWVIQRMVVSLTEIENHEKRTFFEGEDDEFDL